MVQIDNVIIVFRLQFFDHQLPAMGQLMHFINIGIVLHHGVKPVTREKMHFRIRHLLFEATDYRGGEDDIPD